MALVTVPVPGPSGSPIPLAAFGQVVADDINELIVELTPVLSAWSSYTPVWGSSGTQPTLGTSTINGRYAQLGKVGFLEILLTIAAGFTAGTLNYTWSLPPGWTSATNTFGDVLVGPFRMFNNTGGTTLVGVTYVSSAATVLQSTSHNTVGPVSATVPAVPVAGSIYYLKATMELA